MWYQHCGHLHAREHHIYICNGSLKTSVSDKLETTKKAQSMHKCTVEQHCSALN